MFCFLAYLLLIKTKGKDKLDRLHESDDEDEQASSVGSPRRLKEKKPKEVGISLCLSALVNNLFACFKYLVDVLRKKKNTCMLLPAFEIYGLDVGCKFVVLLNSFIRQTVLNV